MYLPPNPTIDADELYEIPTAKQKQHGVLQHGLLQTPILPEEYELLFARAPTAPTAPTTTDSTDETAPTKPLYYWNDRATLQRQMLNFLPSNSKSTCEDRAVFSSIDTQVMIDYVSFMEFHQPQQRLLKAYRETQAYLETKQWSTSSIHTHFARGLLDCAPMQLGFHTLAIPEWCLCPLALPAWRHKYNINASPHELPLCKCYKRDPNAFMTHVRDIQKVGSQLVKDLHAILETFLTAYYQHYIVRHYWHEGMYPKESENYNTVVSRKLLRLKLWMDLGRAAQERLRQETEEKLAKLENNQRVNEILKTVLHREDLEHLEQDRSIQQAAVVLGINPLESAKERKPHPYRQCNLWREHYKSRVNEVTMNHFFSRGNQRKMLCHVLFKDSSWGYMEQLWKDRTHSYLFGDQIIGLECSFFIGMDASPDDDEDGRYRTTCLVLSCLTLTFLQKRPRTGQRQGQRRRRTNTSIPFRHVAVFAAYRHQGQARG